MKTMTDADTLIPAGSVTVLAIELDAAMNASQSARNAYLATWGVEWVSLTGNVKSYAPTTTLGTVR